MPSIFQDSSGAWRHSETGEPMPAGFVPLTPQPLGVIPPCGIDLASLPDAVEGPLFKVFVQPPHENCPAVRLLAVLLQVLRDKGVVNADEYKQIRERFIAEMEEAIVRREEEL